MHYCMGDEVEDGGQGQTQLSTLYVDLDAKEKEQANNHEGDDGRGRRNAGT